MLKNQQNKFSTLTSISQVGSHSRGNNVEELVLHLCQKIASANNLNEITREEFINRSYSTMIKIFCSITYTPVDDTFEISQKIKNKRN